MEKRETLHEEELTRDECIAAVNFSALKIQIAAVKMAAFIIGSLGDDPQLVESAKRLNREINALCERLSALDPQPWCLPIEIEGEVM